MKDAHHLMIDLETLGMAPLPVIASIGACKIHKGQIISKFYERVDIADAQRCGLTIDADTVQWWLKRSGPARMELCGDGALELMVALQRFRHWLTEGPGVVDYVWGNGPTFDLSIMSNVLKHVHLPVPWHYANERCFRTARALCPEPEYQKPAGAHHALNDAVAQGQHLIAMGISAAPSL
jgi:3' exoribonuclease, RNase T-like